jgi:voltage-gated potassium channel
MSDLKKRVRELVETCAVEDRVARAFKLGEMALIMLSVASVILETVPSIHARWSGELWAFELVSVALFTLEYIARLWVCDSDPRYARPLLGRLRYAFSPMALIDLASILPFYLHVFLPVLSPVDVDLRVLRALRLMRLMRLFKFGRYSDSMELMAGVFRSKKEELVVTTFMAGVFLTVFSSLMYYIENAAQPDRFSSIPAAMWWGVATLTTIGYGDIYPVTIAGKILGSMAAITGIGMFALPAGILGSGFVEEMHRRRGDAKRCPHCDKPL